MTSVGKGPARSPAPPKPAHPLSAPLLLRSSRQRNRVDGFRAGRSPCCSLRDSWYPDTCPAVGVHLVAPPPGVGVAGQKLIVPLLEFAGERGLKFGLQFRILWLVHQVVRLVGIGLIVVEEPGPGQVAHVRITRAANTAEFLAADPAHPFPEDHGAKDYGRSIAWVLPAANVAAIVKPLDAPGNRQAA